MSPAGAAARNIVSLTTALPPPADESGTFLAPARKITAPVEPVAPDAPVPERGVKETGAQPLDGIDVLDHVRAHLGRYISTMHESDLDLLALWAAHTHFVMETYTTPRLVLDSPVHGSGKTTVLEHLERLCQHAVQMASLSSPALLTRMLDAGMRTMLIDEADRSLNPDNDGVAELLAVLNSGYKRGGTRPVLAPTGDGGWEAKEMPTYCPVAMAGNNPLLPEDTKSRTIRVLLLPDLEGRVEESDWEMIEADTKALGDLLATWADQVRDDVRANRPPLPDGIVGRGRERWSPLKRVAHAAGGRWPGVVDALALHDKDQQDLDREDGMVRDRPAVAVLKHLHDLWPAGEPFMPTANLVSSLVSHHPDEWGHASPFGKALTVQRFGRMLATAYSLNSARLDRTGPRGYVHASLVPLWKRMGMVQTSGPERDGGEPVSMDREPSRNTPTAPSCSTPTGSAPVCPGGLSGTGASGATGATGAEVEPDDSPF